MASTASQMLGVLGQLQKVQYAQASAAAFLAYDVCFTFSDEVAYIWSAPWSIPKCLYLICRYYGVTLLIGNICVQTTSSGLAGSMCQSYFLYYAIGGRMIVFTAVDVLLALRIHALYRRNRSVSSFLGLLLLAQFILTIILLLVYFRGALQSAYVLQLSVTWFICLANTSRRSIVVSWIPILIVDTIFFLMTILEFMNTFHNGGARRQPIYTFKEMRSYSPIIMAFVRDGTIFYLVSLCNTIMSIAFFKPTWGTLATGAAFAWMIAIKSSAASHLVLSLRRAARKQADWSMESRWIPVTIQSEDSEDSGRHF